MPVQKNFSCADCYYVYGIKDAVYVCYFYPHQENMTERDWSPQLILDQKCTLVKNTTLEELLLKKIKNILKNSKIIQWYVKAQDSIVRQEFY